MWVFGFAAVVIGLWITGFEKVVVFGGLALWAWAAYAAHRDEKATAMRTLEQAQPDES